MMMMTMMMTLHFVIPDSVGNPPWTPIMMMTMIIASQVDDDDKDDDDDDQEDRANNNKGDSVFGYIYIVI